MLAATGHQMPIGLEATALGVRWSHLSGLLFTHWAGSALAVALLAWLGVGRASTARRRQGALIVVSVGVLAWFATPAVAALGIGYALGFQAAVDRLPRRWVPAAVVPLLVTLIVAPILAIDRLGALGGHAREFVAFATNMAALRLWAYFWDRWQRGVAASPAGEFLLAMLFFPTFLNGPVETTRQMAEGWTPPGAATRTGLARGLGRVAIGVIKLVVVALVFAPGWTAMLADGQRVASGQLWLWGVLLYVWFYLSFSAWSDVAIGLGALCGRRVQENFDHPWRATDPADFWRRWHVSLGLWLRDYVYVPLGGGRRRRALNVTITFGVSAAWHVWGSVKLLGLGFFGPHAWGGFALWAVLNTVGVLAARPLRRAFGGRGSVRLAQATTFLFAAWCWVPFFLPPGVPLRSGVGMLLRMLWPVG